MKKITLIFLAVLSAILLYAQTPQAFKYQTVVRDNTGEILDNQPVSLKIVIIKDSIDGAEIYQETHNATTNQLGMVTLEIGSGNVLIGVFENINWRDGIYFLKILMDENGGSNYQLMGISQLLSVPFALYAESSGDAGATQINDLADAKTAGNNLFLGLDAGVNDDSSNNQNVAVGREALNANISGSYNTAIGYNALFSNMEGNQNTATGYNSLFSNTTGIKNAVYGFAADLNNEGGSNNTIIGYQAGRGTDLHSKSGNVYLGYRAGYNDTTDNKLYIENSDADSAHALIYGDFENDILAINGSLGIGTQNPSESAVLELNSNSMGFLLPRLSSAEIQAISNPADGLQVYNTTDGKIYIYVALYSEWKELSYGFNGLSTDCGFPITDPRDQQVYNTVKIGDQCWMAENLNIGIRKDIVWGAGQIDNDTIEKYCYDDLESNCEIYGGLYKWDELMDYTEIEGTQGICPPGWHVPTDIELCDLENFADAGTINCAILSWRGVDNGYHLKSINGWSGAVGNGNDMYGFSVKPGGTCWNGCADIESGAFIWSSSMESISRSYRRILSHDEFNISRVPIDRFYAQSVRCIKD